MADILHLVDIAVCMPVMLILNFSLFQYLLTTFWKRRHDRRVRLLLFIAFLSFVSLIPFAIPSENLTRNLNGISEVCSILTFLIQITILTRDISKRIKIRSIWLLMWVGEALTMVCLALLLTNFVDLVVPVIDPNTVEMIDHTIEYVSLAFIVGFRFYFLAMVKGYRKVVATQKSEIACYTLLLLHGVPFQFLSEATGWSWDHIKGICMRLAIAACLWFTVKARMTSQNSKNAQATTNGPKMSQMDRTSMAGTPSETSKAMAFTPAANGGAGKNTGGRRSVTSIVPIPEVSPATAPTLDAVQDF